MWLRECETQPEETQKSVHQTKEVLFSEEEANVVGYQKQKMSSKIGFFPITKKRDKGSQGKPVNDPLFFNHPLGEGSVPSLFQVPRYP